MQINTAMMLGGVSWQTEPIVTSTSHCMAHYKKVERIETPTTRSSLMYMCFSVVSEHNHKGLQVRMLYIFICAHIVMG